MTIHTKVSGKTRHILYFMRILVGPPLSRHIYNNKISVLVTKYDKYGVSKRHT